MVIRRRCVMSRQSGPQCFHEMKQGSWQPEVKLDVVKNHASYSHLEIEQAIMKTWEKTGLIFNG